MKLFGWKSAGRGSSRPMLSRALTANWFAGEWPRSYEAQVRELYLENAVAQRAVRLVAEGVASAPLAGEADALALVSATSGGQSLLETIAAQLLLHGNAIMLGSEIIQFASAQPIAPKRYRLSGLLRGRRGTEWAMADHAPGDRFVVLEDEVLAPIPVAIGIGQIAVMAVGVGDTVPPTQSLTITGEAIIPPTVASLRAGRISNGDTLVSWIRRSRGGWQWLNGADAPLIEEFERYRIELSPNAGPSRMVEQTSAVLLYSAADRAADVLAGATTMTAKVTQQGTFGRSRPTSIIFPLN